jgi:hypothetical protein
VPGPLAVGGREHSKSFATKTVAAAFLGIRKDAARDGTPFDSATGLPGRPAQARRGVAARGRRAPRLAVGHGSHQERSSSARAGELVILAATSWPRARISASACRQCAAKHNSPIGERMVRAQ